MQISRSGYYAWRKCGKSLRQKENEKLIPIVRAAHNKSKGTYGTRRMAIWRRQPFAGLIFHSDRGSRYCSNDFQKMPEIHGMISSMTRKGVCWDNAVAESFFGRLKTKEGLFFKLQDPR
jgi:hypothetical protein